MKAFCFWYAVLALLNTLCGFDKLAGGTFFEPYTRSVQVWAFFSTLALGVWALVAYLRGK